jgi:hypothetical protein
MKSFIPVFLLVGVPLGSIPILNSGRDSKRHTQIEAQEGLIKGIKLPTVPLYQIISQYADNTTLFLRGEERYVNNSVELLERFCYVSGLLLNWTKSAAFWQYTNGGRPAWTYQY